MRESTTDWVDRMNRRRFLSQLTTCGTVVGGLSFTETAGVLADLRSGPVSHQR